MAASAARKGWDTPIEQRRQYIALARDAASDADVSGSVRASAASALEAFEKAGWVESVDAVQ